MSSYQKLNPSHKLGRHWRRLAVTAKKIAALSQERGHCYASNDYLAQDLMIDPRTLQRRLAELRRHGYLKEVPLRRGLMGRSLTPLGMRELLLIERADNHINTNSVGTPKCRPQDGQGAGVGVAACHPHPGKLPPNLSKGIQNEGGGLDARKQGRGPVKYEFWKRRNDLGLERSTPLRLILQKDVAAGEVIGLRDNTGAVRMITRVQPTGSGAILWLSTGSGSEQPEQRTIDDAAIGHLPLLWWCG